MTRPASLALLTVLLCGVLHAAQERTPQSVADELLAADRAFSDASAKTDLVSGLSAMFADDVAMPAPGKLVQGKAAVIEALRANPDNLKTQVRWMPKRAGVSADGQHGFTFGFMLATGPDGKPTPGKYLAYWVKGPTGWRVAAFKRGRAAGDTPVSAALMPPSLPDTLVPPTTDGAAIARHRESLAAAERAFSTDAQTMGLGPAFVKYGRADAINLGGPNVPTFVEGNEAIGKFIGENSPGPVSPVHWGPDRTIVASSGDLGVTIGTITQNPAAAGASQPQSFPFFTIWRRGSTAEAWKYIAE